MARLAAQQRVERAWIVWRDYLELYAYYQQMTGQPPPVDHWSYCEFLGMLRAFECGELADLEEGEEDAWALPF